MDDDLSQPDRDRLVDEAVAALKELVTEVRDLQQAMTLFGENFDREDFVRTFDRRKGDPTASARVNQVNWPLATLVNEINTILLNSAILGGLRRVDQPPKAPDVYAELRDAGIIDDERAKQLVQLNRTRNSITHRYGLEARGEDVYTATRLAVEVVRSFGQDFRDWLTRTGVLAQR